MTSGIAEATTDDMLETTDEMDGSGGAETSHRRLHEGVHEIVEPIRLTGHKPVLSGLRKDGEIVTRIRRGRLSDGNLYAGPLIQIEDATSPVLKDLIVEGSRFTRSSGAMFDARHPLNSDRTAPDFMCGSVLPEPDCYSAGNFLSAFEADIIIQTCRGGHLIDVWCDAPVRIGVAIGQGVVDLRLDNCRVSRAGDYGVWIGFGGPLADARLPLDPDYRAQLPTRISLKDTTIERCGAAGLFSEAIDVDLLRCRFLANCHDAPYDDEGGQVTADYKSDGLQIRDSLIVGAPAMIRRRPDGQTSLIGAFGIEACGSNLLIENTVIEGNSREGIQIVGGRSIVLRRGVQVFNNHLASLRWPGQVAHAMRPGISITTTQGLADVGARAANVSLADSRCENGLAIWSDGQVPRMRLDGLTVVRSDLDGPDSQGLYIGHDSDGESLAGADWNVQIA